MSRQVRLIELGIVSRIGHNWARYSASQSDAYTPFRFAVECFRAMKDMGLDRSTYRRLMEEAVDQRNQDLLAFAQGLDLSSDGGSACTVVALLAGPCTALIAA